MSYTLRDLNRIVDHLYTEGIKVSIEIERKIDRV